MARALSGRSPLATILGQDHARAVLEAVLRAGDFPPLLFSGPAGTGKRTAALEFCRAANCANPDRAPCGECNACRTIAKLAHPDIRVFFPMGKVGKTSEDDEESGSDIDRLMQATLEESENYQLGRAQPVQNPRHQVRIPVIRWLRREMARPPLLARTRCFIILSCHRMNEAAANALLKSLEEPQASTTLILTTDSPHSLPDTIRSRCRLVRFGAIDRATVKNWLMEHAGADAESAAVAAEVGDGSLGRALGFLNEPADYLPEPVLVLFGRREPDHAEVLAAAQALARTPPAATVRALLFLYRQVLLVKKGQETEYSRRNPAVAAKTRQVSDDYLLRALKFLTERLADARLNIDARLFNYTLLSALRKAR